MAQLAQASPDGPDLYRQLVDVCSRQTDRIRTMLESLHELVEEMNFKIVDYAGTPDAMIEIEELEEKLRRDKEEGSDDESSLPSDT